MKKIFLLIVLLYSGHCLNAQTLSGRITDSATHLSVPGAVVSIPHLKLGATADADGFYKIEKAPAGTYNVKVQCLSYATKIKQVVIDGATTLNMSLTATSSNMQDVVVTALGVNTTNMHAPMPILAISNAQLFETTATNAIDALAKEPGITAITTGPGVSKPEINGLGYNRVLTLFDGERQEDFQWGDEHGILIDPNAVYSAEIIRGPASLQYGNYAVGGVVSFKSEPMPESGTIQGSVLQEYQTNNGMIGTSFDVAGNHNGFFWDLRGSNEEAHCYTDPKDGYVWGTAYTQQNIRGVMGVNKKWGTSKFSVSSLHRQIEIPDGNRDSTTGQFAFDVPQSADGFSAPQYYSAANAPNPSLVGTLVPGTGKVSPTLSNFLSYNPNISGYQVLNHDAVWWQNNIYVGRGNLTLDVGFTQSEREEIDTGLYPSEHMTVHDIPYTFKYQVEDYSGLKFTTGVNGMYEFEKNASEPPAPYIGDFEIPNYTDFDAGAFAIVEKDFKNLTLSGGLRYDYRSMVGQPMYLGNYATTAQEPVPNGGVTNVNGTYIANTHQNVVPAGDTLFQQFTNFNRTFAGPSASIGATYQLPQNNYIKLNVALSYRAPSISELTSNELDPSTVYRLGDPNLKAEQGYEMDFAYGNNGRDINFEVDGFANYISNFIFPSKLASVFGGDSLQLGAPVYKYGATNAILAGVAAYFNIHPADVKWLEIKNGFTYTYSYIPNATDSTNHVPWTPAPRLTSEVRFKLGDKPNSILKGSYIQFGVEHDWAQNNIYAANYNELPSFAYTLYNAGIGTNFVNKKTHRTVARLSVNCTNLMNLAYVDHTSRLQYFWAYNGSYAGLANNGVTAATVTQQSQGIYNMGRNVGIKLIYPFGGHKVSETEMNGVDKDK